MKISHLVHSLEEARRNNVGREVSNVQGQNLGKRLAAGDPTAQTDLAAAKAAQATNTTDAGADALGQTTPAQRLAAKKASAGAGGAAFGNMASTLGGATEPAVDPNAPQASSTGGTIQKTPTGQTHVATPANPNQPPAAVPAEVPGQAATPAATTPAAAPAAGGPNKTQMAQSLIGKAGDIAGSVAGAVANPLGGFVGGLRKGYNAQSGQAASGYTPRSGSGSAAPAASGADANTVQALTARIDALEKRIGATAEGFTFESKFLGMKI
jgi:hypothetical protein